MEFILLLIFFFSLSLSLLQAELFICRDFLEFDAKKNSYKQSKTPSEKERRVKRKVGLLSFVLFIYLFISI